MKYTYFFLVSALAPIISHTMHFKHNKSIAIQFNVNTNQETTKMICMKIKNNYIKKQHIKNDDTPISLDPNGIDIQEQTKKNKEKKYYCA